MSSAVMHWRDWSGSALLHAALLASVVWGFSQSASVSTPITRLDMPMTWEQPAPPEPPPIAQPTPVLPPIPASPLPATPQKVPVLRPAPAPTVTPLTTPQATPVVTSVQAADTVVATPETAAKPSEVNAPTAAATVATAPSPAVPSAQSQAAQQARWHSVLEAALLKHKQYPMVARRMRQEGVVMVEANFSAAGEVLHCVIANSSGFKALDEAALQLVRLAAERVRASHQPGHAEQLRIPIAYEIKES